MSYEYDERFVYEAQIARIVDGDTLDLDIDLGFGVWLRGRDARVRLFGIDTPETYGVKHDSDEYRRGMAAKARLADLCPIGSHVWIHTHKGKRGKFGRWVAVIWTNFAVRGDIKASVNYTLYREGYAALYPDEPLVKED